MPVEGHDPYCLMYVAAIVMVGAFVYGFQISAEPKLAAAMLVFGIGAVAGLVSSFIADPNRIVRAGKCPKGRRCRARSCLARHCRRHHQRRSLSFSGIAMVGTTSTARSSSQPKTRLQDKALAERSYDANKDASRISPTCK